MRCACPTCGDFMPQMQGDNKCVCPHCGYTCAACLGASTTPLSLEQIKQLRFEEADENTLPE
jgi:hypothetical protein